MNYEIIPMTLKHVPQIAKLEQSCFSMPWSAESLGQELENPLSLWLIAQTLEGEVVGYVGAQTVLGESDMMNLAVAPSYRRNGIGKALVLALFQALQKQGSCKITLEVRASNFAALALYESLGFLKIGKRPGYYLKPKEDAWILGKEWRKDDNHGNRIFL